VLVRTFFITSYANYANNFLFWFFVEFECLLSRHILFIKFFVVGKFGRLTCDNVWVEDMSGFEPSFPLVINFHNFKKIQSSSSRYLQVSQYLLMLPNQNLKINHEKLINFAA
jgi:hypothetical protein